MFAISATQNVFSGTFEADDVVAKPFGGHGLFWVGASDSDAPPKTYKENGGRVCVVHGEGMDPGGLCNKLLSSQTVDDMFSVMEDRCHGVFNFALYDNGQKILYFGKDVLAGGSLLSSLPKDNMEEVLSGQTVAVDKGFTLSSVDTGSQLEVPPCGIYRLNLLGDKLEAGFHIDLVRFPTRPAIYRFDPPESELLSRWRGNMRPFELVKDQDVGAQLLLASLCRAVELRSKDVGDQCVVSFSGGIDSVVLAACLDKVLPREKAIVLVNVAFGEAPFNANPDRVAFPLAYRELKSVSNLDRVYIPVAVNVTAEEFAAARVELAKYCAPRISVMDVNIAAACWFVCKGKGVRLNFPDPDYEAAAGAGIDYTRGNEYSYSTAIIFNGLGPDELIAGYGKHSAAYKRGGADAVRRELHQAVMQLWERNSGRDARVCIPSRTTLRLPYLDACVVELLTQRFDLDLLADFSLGRGLGEKLVLRWLAQQLGMTRTARRAKKAVQFASGSAKLFGKGEKGTAVILDDVSTQKGDMAVEN